MCFTLWICLYDKVPAARCSSARELVTFDYVFACALDLSQYLGNSSSLWLCSVPAGTNPCETTQLLKTHREFLLPRETAFPGAGLVRYRAARLPFTA